LSAGICADPLGLFAAAFIPYTLAGIVLATNYGSGLGAVPRYAFTIMPLLVLLVGTWLIARMTWLCRPASASQ